MVVVSEVVAGRGSLRLTNSEMGWLALETTMMALPPVPQAACVSDIIGAGGTVVN